MTAICSLAISPVTAAIIATEDFESYTPDVILTGGTGAPTYSVTPETAPGGTGWDNTNGGWDSSNDPNNDGELTRGDRKIVQRTVTTAGNGIDGQSFIIEGGRDASNIATREFPAQTGDVYIGLDLKTSDDWADSFLQLYVNDTRASSNTNSMSYGLARDNTPGPGSFYAREGTNATTAGSAMDPTQLHRVVAKFSKSGASTNYDEVTVWVDSFNDASPLVQHIEEWTGDTLSVLHFRMSNEGGVGDLGDTVMFDNIVVATTLQEAAAVPEPSSVALLVTLVMGGLVIRFRNETIKQSLAAENARS